MNRHSMQAVTQYICAPTSHEIETVNQSGRGSETKILGVPKGNARCQTWHWTLSVGRLPPRLGNQSRLIV